MSTDTELIATLAISGHSTHDMFGPVTIGREPRATEGAAIPIADDPLVSKSHLAIDFDQGSLVITDLGSSNGTYLHHRSGETAVPSDRWIPLPVGAEVEFGDQRMTVVRVAAALEIDHGDVIDHDDDETPEKLLRPTAVTCDHCHRLLNPGVKFCDGCGLAALPVTPPAVALTGSTEVVVVPDASAFETPAKTQRGGARTLIPFVIVALMVGVVGFFTLRLVGGDDVAERNELPLVPVDPSQVWSTSVSGQEPSALIGDAAIYVVARVDDRAQLTSLDREDGEPRWVTDIERADFAFLIDEFESAMVAQVCSFESDTVCRVIGFDNETGEELWSERIGRGFAVSTSAGVLVQNDGVLSLREAATGDRVTRARGEIVFSDPDVILVRDRNDVGVYDDALREVFPSVEIDEGAEAVTFDGTRIVALIDGEIEYVDQLGDTVGGAQLGAPVTRVVAVDEDVLVVEQGGEVVVYDMVGDDALERWSEPGTLDVVLFADGGPVVIVDGADEQRVVDLATGDVRFDIDGSRSSGVATRPGSNLLVVVAASFETGPTETISARNWLTGDELWAQQVAGRFAFDGALVVAREDGDVTFFE